MFRTYCINFYEIFLWRRYNSAVLKKFEAAYIKCIKMFFGYDRRHSVTVLWCWWTCDYLLHLRFYI